MNNENNNNQFLNENDGENVTMGERELSANGLEQSTADEPMVVEQSEMVASTQPIPEQKETVVNTQSIPEQSETVANTQPISEQRETVINAQPIPEQRETVVNAQPISEQRETVLNTQPIPEQRETVVNTQSIPEQRETVVNAQPIPEQRETVVNTQPIPEQRETVVNTQPTQEQRETVVNAQPIPEQRETVVNTQPTQEQRETVTTAQPTQEQSETVTITQATTEQPTREKGSGNKKLFQTFAAGFLGAVIGSAAMFGGLSLANEQTPIGTSNVASPREVTVTNISNEDLTAIISEAQKSVVGVVNMQRASTDVSSLFGERQAVEGEGELRAAGSGSGIVYKISGEHAYIVTNHHVIENADEVEITLSDGTKLPARIVGSDAFSDLAVLEVAASEVDHVATLGDSDVLLAGQSVIAIGNPLGFLEGTVTQGIVSSSERTIETDINGDGVADWPMTVIQTDAAINPGNSGGALLNANGEVIGINSSKIADATVEGIGFAIPINSAMSVLEQLETNGVVTRPQMGVQLVDLAQVSVANRTSVLRLPESVTTGAVVSSVTEGSPAAIAGLQIYDVITAIDGQEVTSSVDIRQYLFNETSIGDEITVTFYREGQQQTAQLTLGATQNQN